MLGWTHLHVLRPCPIWLLLNLLLNWHNWLLHDLAPKLADMGLQIPYRRPCTWLRTLYLLTTVCKSHLHGLGHNVLSVHLDCATEWVPLQHLLLLLRHHMVVALHCCYRDCLSLMQLLVSLGLGLLLLHLDLLLDPCDLIPDAHSVILHLLRHL